MLNRTRLTPPARSLNGRQHLLVSVFACTCIVTHVGRRRYHCICEAIHGRFLSFLYFLRYGSCELYSSWEREGGFASLATQFLVLEETRLFQYQKKRFFGGQKPSKPPKL